MSEESNELDLDAIEPLHDPAPQGGSEGAVVEKYMQSTEPKAVNSKALGNTQYAVLGQGYIPTAPTVETLPPGAYDLVLTEKGTFAVPCLPPTGLLLELPEMRSEEVLELAEKFWNSEKDYKDGNDFVCGGATFKSGIMIYGPPGTGKTCTIKLIAKKLVERGGVVFHASTYAEVINGFLTNFSRIEKDRKCTVILEDIDTLIARNGESGYLEMLDSAKTIDNVLFIATTNYPDRLDPRIYNRPGRFSHVVKIGLPTKVAREAFLKAILKSHRDVDRIVQDTDGFSIDHLSALVNAVYREKKEIGAELKRLRSLFKIPMAEDAKVLGI